MMEYQWNRNNCIGDDRCLDFNTTVIKFVTIARPTIASVGAAMCLLAIAMVIFVLKEYRKFGYRLVLYLMAATFFVSLSQALAVAPLKPVDKWVEVKKGWENMCIFTGWLIQIGAWLEHMIVGWVTVYLLVLTVISPLVYKRPYVYRLWHEMVGLAIVLTVPIVVSMIPFIHGMYGLSGLWCWIEVIGECCSTQFNAGMGFMFGLYYGPFILLILFSAVAFLVMMVVLCLATRQGNDDEEQEQNTTAAQKKIIKETFPLLLYPVVYDLLFIFQAANRIYYSVSVLNGAFPYEPLWIAHIIVDSGRCIYPPLAFLLHPSTLRRLWKKMCARPVHVNHTINRTEFIVSKEFSSDSQEPLVIRGTSNSFRRERELGIVSDSYRSILQ